MEVVPIRPGQLRDAAVLSVGGEKERRLKNGAAVSVVAEIDSLEDT
jgi:hypothetical protein